MSPSVPSDVHAAWQAALAAEHRAAFGYPLVGAQLSGAQRALASACERAHNTLRDLTMAQLVASGQTPVAPLGDYPQLYPARGAGPAIRLAIRLESDCAAAWRFLYAAAAQQAPTAALRTLRRDAQTALSAAAVRAVRWRQASGAGPLSVAFPGI
jgi:hypothetical protein